MIPIACCLRKSQSLPQIKTTSGAGTSSSASLGFGMWYGYLWQLEGEACGDICLENQRGCCHELWQSLYDLDMLHTFFHFLLGDSLIAMHVFVVAYFSSAKSGYCLVGAINLGYGLFCLFPNDPNKETVWFQ